MKKEHLIILFFLCISMMAIGQNLNFVVQTSNDTLLLGNYFEIRFTIHNETGKFESPDFNDFFIVGGPNSSSSVQMINGEVTQKSSYSYFLEAREAGSFTITEAYFYTDNNVFETIPFSITVLENPDGIIQKPDPIPDQDLPLSFDDPFKKNKTKKPRKKIKRHKI